MRFDAVARLPEPVAPCPFRVHLQGDVQLSGVRHQPMSAHSQAPGSPPLPGWKTATLGKASASAIRRRRTRHL
jgi:hypothetical protein